MTGVPGPFTPSVVYMTTDAMPSNTKGGVGKTTLAFLISVARARAGRDVWLVDADPQGSASTAATVRADGGREPVLACSAYPDARALGIQLRRQASKFEDVVIDVGGRDTEALRVALVLADTVLIPGTATRFGHLGPRGDCRLGGRSEINPGWAARPRRHQPRRPGHKRR